MAEQLYRAGVRLETPPDTARLIVRTLRKLAGGKPVPMATAAELAADLGDAAEGFQLVTL